MPTDLKEYSNCEQQIEDAITALSRAKAKRKTAAGTNGGAPAGGSGGTGGSTPSSGSTGSAATPSATSSTDTPIAPAFAAPTPAEENAAARARVKGPVDVGVGRPIAPSSATALHQGLDALPTAVRALLVGFALAALVALAVVLRRFAGGLRRPP